MQLATYWSTTNVLRVLVLVDTGVERPLLHRNPEHSPGRPLLSPVMADSPSR